MPGTSTYNFYDIYNRDTTMLYYIHTTLCFRISSQRFKDIALQISAIFPGEVSQIYYIPYRKSPNGPLSARGVLWDKYMNRRRTLRKIGMIDNDKNKETVIQQELYV